MFFFCFWVWQCMLMKLKQKNNKNNFITWDKKLTATELLGYIMAVLLSQVLNDKNWTGVWAN